MFYLPVLVPRKLVLVLALVYKTEFPTCCMPAWHPSTSNRSLKEKHTQVHFAAACWIQFFMLIHGFGISASSFQRWYNGALLL